jgi:hypothetical protein
METAHALGIGIAIVRVVVKTVRAARMETARNVRMGIAHALGIGIAIVRVVVKTVRAARMGIVPRALTEIVRVSETGIALHAGNGLRMPPLRVGSPMAKVLRSS